MEQDLTSAARRASAPRSPGSRPGCSPANEHDRPLCWDYLLDADLADAEALAAYLAHPPHQALLPELRAYFELAVVDYDADQSRGRPGD